jgi:8-oxo-dGTP diphosphatase
VAVFARNAGEILLVRHKRLELWLPVGGEIEPGETPLEAARRELREETGLDGVFPSTSSTSSTLPGLAVDGTPPGLIGYEEHPAGSKGLHMNFAFVADVPTRALTACDEYTAVRWVGDPVPVECPLNVRQLVRLALAAHHA